MASGLLLAGCQTYAPAKLTREAYPQAMALRRLGDPDRLWSEPELLSLTLSQNPDILAAKAKRLSAQRLADASRARPLAGLTLSAEYANNAGSSPWMYGAGFDLPADQGVRRKARLTLADLDRLQADFDYRAVVWEARGALARAIISRQTAAAGLETAQHLADLRQRRADLIETRVSAGEDPRSATLAARADLSAARHRVADALARSQQANADLAKALGVDIVAVEGLRLDPILSGAGGAEAGSEAALWRSDVLAAILAYDRAEVGLRLEIARQFPEVRLSPGYSWDHGVVKLPFNLALVLPPADLNRANIQVAEARRLEAARNLEAVEAQVLSQLARARDTLSRAGMQIALIRDGDLPAAQGMANAADRALKAGEVDQTDALAARAALMEVELTQIEARGAQAAAVVDLEAALQMISDPGAWQVLNNELQTGLR
jgi:CRISPR system Cascade subunit CasA